MMNDHHCQNHDKEEYQFVEKKQQQQCHYSSNCCLLLLLLPQRIRGKRNHQYLNDSLVQFRKRIQRSSPRSYSMTSSNNNSSSSSSNDNNNRIVLVETNSFLEKELIQILSNHHQKRQQQQEKYPHHRSNSNNNHVMIVNQIHHLVQSLLSQKTKTISTTIMDYKLVERMYQEAVESSLSSSSTNQVDDQVKYLTSRLLQEMGLIGSNRSSSSSTSTSTTTTHGDEIQPQEHEQQEKQKQQQQQAAILALYELNFGLSHYDDPLISVRVQSIVLLLLQHQVLLPVRVMMTCRPPPLFHCKGLERRRRYRPLSLLLFLVLQSSIPMPCPVPCCPVIPQPVPLPCRRLLGTTTIVCGGHGMFRIIQQDKKVFGISPATLEVKTISVFGNSTPPPPPPLALLEVKPKERDVTITRRRTSRRTRWKKQQEKTNGAYSIVVQYCIKDLSPPEPNMNKTRSKVFLGGGGGGSHYKGRLKSTKITPSRFC